MIARQNDTLALDVRGGSYCIYKKSDFKCIDSGEVDKFHSFDDMYDHAVREFNKLHKAG